MEAGGGMTWEVRTGDCVAEMQKLAPSSVNAIVTDPPYGLEFMGKEWDALGKGWNDRAQASQTGQDKGDFSWFGGNVRPRYGSDPHAMQEWHQAWATEALRVLKPGGHLLAFGGTRTYHRLVCAIEDAGFEIRDTIAWMYGSGFPKSLDVSKAIDKAERGVPQGGPDPTSEHHGQYRTTTTEGKRWEGDSGQGYGAGGSRFLATTVSERTTAPDTSTTEDPDAAVADDPPRSTRAATASEWDGWGTALKPAHEPVVVARKPLSGTVAQTVLEHGTGGLNIDGCRVGTTGGGGNGLGSHFDRLGNTEPLVRHGEPDAPSGRWPANVVLDEEAARLLDEQSGEGKSTEWPTRPREGTDTENWRLSKAYTGGGFNDRGGASRFFYTAKSSRAERNAGLEGFEEREAPDFDGRPSGDFAKRMNRERPPVLKQNVHPTVKPIALMRWLVRLVTPPDGLVLDCFAGSGTTGCAAVLEGFDFLGLEREPEYVEIARARIAYWADPKAHDLRVLEAERLEARAEAEANGEPVQLDIFDALGEPEPPRKTVDRTNREGEASADRRYTNSGSSNFAMKPGKRRVA